MAIELYYKGLSAEDRLYPQTPDIAVSKAKGTIYEAWFDALQTSPWYEYITETKDFLSDKAKTTWGHFGDLRNKTFVEWWHETGYRIFAEQVPYRPIQIANVQVRVKQRKSERVPPILSIEVPLNISPAVLQEQFKQLLRRQEEYQDDFDRWDHSTAAVHQYRETKLNYNTIKRWLTVYREYEKRKDQEGFKLYNLAWELDLHPTMFVGLIKNKEMPKEMRTDASNVASDMLKNAKFLMAHATEGQFPCTDSHPWAVSGTRDRRD